MPEISRRFFVFGSAATLAAVALPEIAHAVPAEQIYTAMTSSPAHGMRRVFDLEFRAIPLAKQGDDESFVPDNMIGISVSRYPDNTAIFSASCNERANYMWRAGPEGPIMFPEGSLMIIEATGVPSEVIVYGNDADGSFMEKYDFPSAVCQVERWAFDA